jgi:hypothetical protein
VEKITCHFVDAEQPDRLLRVVSVRRRSPRGTNTRKERHVTDRLDVYIPAEDVARMLGILTATLAKWRRTGRGPRRWVYRSKNRVLYPHDAVEEFLASLPQRVEKSGTVSIT